MCCFFFFFQAEDGIRDVAVTGVQTCALPISREGDRHRIAKQVAVLVEPPIDRAEFIAPLDDTMGLVHGQERHLAARGREAVHQRTQALGGAVQKDRKSTRLNSSHGYISYAVFCLKKKKNN